MPTHHCRRREEPALGQAKHPLFVKGEIALADESSDCFRDGGSGDAEALDQAGPHRRDAGLLELIDGLEVVLNCRGALAHRGIVGVTGALKRS
jgi:hypothetical protein